MMSVNLLLFIFLSPIKVIDEILVSEPLLISKIKSILFSSISFNFASTVEKLKPKDE